MSLCLQCQHADITEDKRGKLIFFFKFKVDLKFVREDKNFAQIHLQKRRTYFMISWIVRRGHAPLLNLVV